MVVKVPVERSTHIPATNIDSPVQYKGKRALIVEDNRNNRLLANRLLHELGLEIKEAQNGMEALGLIRQYDFDIILMDIQMPILDGVEATKLIRKLPDVRSNTPIIALTAHVLNDEVSRYIEVGMNSLIRKPIKREELIKELQRFLGGVEEHQFEAKVDQEGLEPTESNNLVDLASLKDLAKGDLSFIREMIEVFFEDIPGYVSEMKKAMKEENLSELGRLAH